MGSNGRGAGGVGGNGKAVVIGGGLGGLAVAARLARAGWRVTLVEQGPTLGGKMNLWEWDGYRFDTGPSLLTMPWVFEDLFAACGERMSDHLELIRVDPLAEYVFDDGERFRHTASLPEWLRAVRRLEGGDASGFWGFMHLGARLYELSRATFFVSSPFERPAAGTARRTLAARPPLRRAWGNYAAAVRHYFRSPHLRRMYDRYTTYVGSSPWLAPATLAVIPYLEWTEGVWHVRGGMYRMVEAVARLCGRGGVELRTNARAVRIELREGRVAAVALESGDRLAADVVVMNGDASRTPALLGEAGGGLPERERSLSGLVFLFALRDELPGCPHHSVFFSADYRAEFDELFARRTFPSDPTVYVNVPSRTDRSVTPGRGEVMFVMANAPANDADAWDVAAVEEARRRVLGRLQRGGFPEFREKVAASAVWTPRDMARRYDMPGGAIYGRSSHGWRGAFLRPPNRNRAVGGLYHVGGSTHPGGGTPTVLLSARIVAELVERYERA